MVVGIHKYVKEVTINVPTPKEIVQHLKSDPWLVQKMSKMMIM